LEDYQNTVQTAMANCQQTLARIQKRIELLESDSKATEAFQFMNRAMWQQRIHSIYSEQKRQGIEVELVDVDTRKNRTWRSFQVAFILLNLPSITQLEHPDRCHPTNAIADLLWFPTGGGKTEAYLVLTAYTIALTRLQGVIAGRSGDSGVAVLMRYTLRLLTLQQFRRATALICACEEIRRQDEAKWGREPFRIGLWVGQKTTPNRTEQSEEVLKQKLGQYQPTSSGSPHQLTNCPRCGTKIDPGKQHIKVDSFAKGQGRTLTYYGDSLGRCLFTQKNSPTEGLPVVVMVMRLDDWGTTHTTKQGEEPLLAAVRSELGYQVKKLLSPPIAPYEQQTSEAHRRWRRIRSLEDFDANYPGICYILLHSQYGSDN
jgi:hypothetical protein